MIMKFDTSTQLARVVVVVSLVGLVMLIECGGSSGDEEIDCEPSNSCDNSMICTQGLPPWKYFWNLV